MPSIAEQLRAARELKNLTVYHVAETTKIKTDHVRALEEGNYGAFPAPVYIRGFVRTYATLLHLNVPQVMADLDQELSSNGQFQDATGIPARRRTLLDTLSLLIAKVNWRWVVSLGAIALVVMGSTMAFRAWKQSRAADPLSNLGPGLYQSRQRPAGETLPLPVPAQPPKR